MSAMEPSFVICLFWSYKKGEFFKSQASRHPAMIFLHPKFQAQKNARISQIGHQARGNYAQAILKKSNIHLYFRACKSARSSEFCKLSYSLQVEVVDGQICT